MPNQPPPFRDVVKAPVNLLAFPDDQYIKEPRKKKQIVLHHTASGRGVDGDYRTWLSNKERIATCVIIEDSGLIAQLFPSAFWGYHLGVTNDQVKKALGRDVPADASKLLNSDSLAIEIDSWGYLKKIGNEYRAYPNKFGTEGPKVVVPKEQVQLYPDGFKGYTAFQKYTKNQIETTRQLLIWWSLTYGIPLEYKKDIWDITPRAMGGEPGVFTHNSYRKDKSDIHPQPDMIAMLKTLDTQWRSGNLLNK